METIKNTNSKKAKWSGWIFRIILPLISILLISGLILYLQTIPIELKVYIDQKKENPNLILFGIIMLNLLAITISLNFVRANALRWWDFIIHLFNVGFFIVVIYVYLKYQKLQDDLIIDLFRFDIRNLYTIEEKKQYFFNSIFEEIQKDPNLNKKYISLQVIEKYLPVENLNFNSLVMRNMPAEAQNYMKINYEMFNQFQLYRLKKFEDRTFWDWLSTFPQKDQDRFIIVSLFLILCVAFAMAFTIGDTED